jgi:hypothetical protein
MVIATGWERLRRAPTGLVGMVVLVLGIETWLTRREATSFTTIAAASWKSAADEASGGAARADVMFFGDSVVKFGLAPRVVEERSKLRVYNLATFGGPPALSELLLRRALASGARPRAVVVDIRMEVLAANIRCHERVWQEVLQPREALRLAWASRDASLFLSLMFGRYLTSYRVRYEARENVRLALRGESYTERLTRDLAARQRHWRSNRGGELAARRPGHPTAPDTSNPALFPTAWRPDPVSAGSARRFLDLALANGVRVYWLMPPVAPASQRHLERLGLESIYAKLIAGTASHYPNVVVVDARHSGYGDEVFRDMVHLDRAGAAALSAAVGDLIRKDLAHPGETWVKLPPYEEPPTALALEDLEQTLQTLDAEKRRR